MARNPYQSPSGGNLGARWFRPWRVLTAVGLFLVLILGPLFWQAERERRARRRAAQNLRHAEQALQQYFMREHLNPLPPRHDGGAQQPATPSE